MSEEWTDGSCTQTTTEQIEGKERGKRYVKNPQKMEAAVMVVIQMLVDREPHSKILAEWDRNRKNYWF